MKTPNPSLSQRFKPRMTLRGAWIIAVALLPLSLFAQEAPKEPAEATVDPVPAAEVKPGAPVDAAAGAPPATTAKKKQVLNFENADLRVVLQAMAKQAGISLILPEDVKGTVTARLVDVPVEKAMRTILESKGFSLIELDGVYQVKSKESIAAEPTKTEIYTFANASAKEAKPTVDKLLTKNGNAQLDDRSNTLVITDVPSNLAKLTPILKSLDTPTPQVLIEAKLIETKRNPKEDIGINWNSLGSYPITAQGVDTVTATTVTFGNWRSLITGGINQPGFGDRSTGFNFQRSPAPGPGTTGGYPVFGQLSAPEFKVTLSFLMQDSDTDLLSSPKVITADNKEAVIRITTQEPIPNFTFNQTTASFVLSGFEFKDVGNILTVTPHVNRENNIVMDVKPEVSSNQGDKTFALGGSGGSVGIPVIDIRTLTSRVMVKSGNTLALGGLLSNLSKRSYTKVPFLGDIPLVGEIFRSHSYDKTKRNLLIFVTPTIIGTEGTGLEDQYAKLKEVDENDRFPYKKTWIGNAKPRDQFGSHANHSPWDDKVTGEVLTDKVEVPKEPKSEVAPPAGSAPAVDETGSSPSLNQDLLAPRLAPGLRE